MKIKSYGIEMELPVASLKDGSSAGAKDFITDLAVHWASDNPEISTLSCKNGMIVAGFDNAYNNIEFSAGPVFHTDGGGGLGALNRLSIKALWDISILLSKRGLGLINFSEHPAFACTQREYAKFCLPRPIYDYWNHGRNWHHVCGIDAKAQTSPCTGVSPCNVLTALNIIMGFSPAFIALYANSPFENGRVSGFHANRLNMWRRMFHQTAYDGDNRVRRFPDKPFISLYDYFEWMLGAGTVMHAVQLMPDHFKEDRDLYVIEGRPSLFEFLLKDNWAAKAFSTGETRRIAPRPFHFEYHQFAQFSDARIRFSLQDMDIKELRDAVQSGDVGFDNYFTDHAAYTYIEGRVPCTNLPDRYVLSKEDKKIQDSVTISSSAMQAGLLTNHEKALELIRSTGWKAIKRYRYEAIRDGLTKEVAGFVENALNIAEEGLASADKWMLSFPQDTLKSGMNAAARALKEYKEGVSITGLIKKRMYINTRDMN